MTTLVRAFAVRLRQLFSLRTDTDYDGTIRQVKSDVEFNSGNIWALVFAILIASVGLNVNSTAVIIGAMLISPLMGPIVGAGFGLAANDIPLLRHSARSLLIASAVALVSSTLYFAISPLADAQSELLARTRPTLYDVLIALFGGAAGVVAVSRKSGKGNVVPGVAIATALMPPLCTAGFGIAQGDIWFVLGALHLFLINALFICLATFGFARLMHFKRVAELDATHTIHARISIILITLGIAIPSVYTGWNVVQETRFQQAARRFVTENLAFRDRTIVNVELRYSRTEPTISATLLGQPLSADLISSLEQRLPSYGLENAHLVLSQPVEQRTSVEQLGQMVRQGVIEDIYKRNEEALIARDKHIRELEAEVARLRGIELPIRALAAESSALYPAIVSLAMGHEVRVEVASTDPPTAEIVVVSWRKKPSASAQEKLSAFLKVRLAQESLRVVHVVAR